MTTINPILVLAGAAAQAGCGIFASQLVAVEGGCEAAQAVIDREPRLQGLTAVSVGMVLHQRLNHGVWWVTPTTDLE